MVPPGDPRAVEAFQSAIRTVDGVALWQDRNPRVRPDDVARAAAERDACIVVGLGDSIMYGMVIDLTDWLDAAPAADVRMDHCHLNGEGHRRIAEHLTEYLLAHDLR